MGVCDALYIWFYTIEYSEEDERWRVESVIAYTTTSTTVGLGIPIHHIHHFFAGCILLFSIFHGMVDSIIATIIIIIHQATILSFRDVLCPLGLWLFSSLLTSP